jgi:hypothetical protein
MNGSFFNASRKDSAMSFFDVEMALHHDFLPALFREEKVDDAIRQLSSLPVKKAGLAIPNPMTTTESNWTSSTVICGHPVAAIRGRVDFQSADHQQIWNSGSLR